MEIFIVAGVSSVITFLMFKDFDNAEKIINNDKETE